VGRVAPREPFHGSFQSSWSSSSNPHIGFTEPKCPFTSSLSPVRRSEVSEGRERGEGSSPHFTSRYWRRPFPNTLSAGTIRLLTADGHRWTQILGLGNVIWTLAEHLPNSDPSRGQFLREESALIRVYLRLNLDLSCTVPAILFLENHFQRGRSGTPCPTRRARSARPTSTCISEINFENRCKLELSTHARLLSTASILFPACPNSR